MSDLEAVIELATTLSPSDKVRLIEQIASSLHTELVQPDSALVTDNPMLLMIEASDRLGLHADREDISENFDDELRKTWEQNLGDK